MITCLTALVSFPLVALGQIAETKLAPSDGAAGDYFGNSVSISDDYAIVGAKSDDDNGVSSGAAYVFRNVADIWVQDGKLIASDGVAGDYFGWSVSISGDYAVVGAFYDDDGTGSAYVFRRDSASWIEEAKLTASDREAEDGFGISVSISSEYVLVGASSDDDFGSASGSVYVFRLNSGTWIEEAKITAGDGAAYDYFGWSVSISGDRAVIGAYQDDDNGPGSGSAYILRRDGTTWLEEAKLTASDGASGDWFGFSASISGDYAIAGAGNGPRVGSAYVFKRDGMAWTEEAKLVGGDVTESDYFGWSVSISGDYAFMGAILDNNDNGPNAGSAYLFRRDGEMWEEEVKLTASDGAADDWFGHSVALFGEHALVGALYDDDNGSNAGSAYVYSGLSPTNCNDYTSLVTRCLSGGTVQARLILLNNIAHSGETVLFQIDSTTYPATIVDNGISSRASISVPGLGSGSHTVSVLDPSGCFSPRVVACATGMEKANREWDEDEARWVAEKENTRIAAAPPETRLLGNYPNPFNPSTSINYVLSEDGFVSLKIFNTLGEEVATLVNEYQVAGIKSAVWDGKNNVGSQVASGIYVYRLATGTYIQTGRMLLMK